VNIKMKKIGMIVCICLFAMCMFVRVFAGNSSIYAIDVYKTTQLTAEQINKKFYKEFQDIAETVLSSKSMTSKANGKKFAVLCQKITDGITQMGHFSYVHVSNIMYSNVKKIYFTIDIVDIKDKNRLSLFNANPTKSFRDPDNLISQWGKYEQTAFDIAYRTKIFPAFKNCPAYHCVFGFEHPLLQKYQPIFEKEVPKQKLKLIEILRQDKDYNKRAAAAYLLAHIKNGGELIKILIPSMYDSNELVRNNVMRVIALALRKVKNVDFPIEKVVAALDFPDETNRNKALAIISELATQPRYAKYIKENASQQIMDNLRMIQPNLHDTAYLILLGLSGQTFGERDYTSWERWLVM
jgi:hypothetical protein